MWQGIFNKCYFNTDMIKKGITLFDIHTPEEDKPSLQAVELFMEDFKPDYLIWAGDLGQWESFSHWEDGYCTTQTEDDFSAVNNVILRQQRICGGTCKYIFRGESR